MTPLGLLLVLLPLTAFANAAYRARRHPGESAAIFRRAFLASGVVFLGIALLMMLGLFDTYRPEAADLVIKLGLGMMIGGVACAIAERR
ncbi:hypothetical protein [Planobispora takensis]|uniref:Uncharacterized protein n=1 Tax=Planobispora takensis TaxID=1367882 RepID=A0A8J3T5Q0_9ACTN|nr:hypothetical protein [Planobispora takensis]GII06178.1 hypothetical protein Pta02_81860 [Planobispora takensis]